MTKKKKPGRAARREPGYVNPCSHNSICIDAAAQRSRLLDGLRLRPLTTLQARRELDVLHPAARVMELRRDGYPIDTTWAYDVTSEGYRHRVARYSLTGERRQYAFAFAF
jgi:hypothetical protein